MSTHPLQWQAPQPLWARFGDTPAAAVTGADQARPAILRFATDEFMEQLLGTLARDPSRLGHLVARPETWRAPAAERVELIERTPIPRVAQSAARATLALRPKTSIAATAPEADVAVQGRTRRLPLKLYHPAQQRHYVVGASLVCGLRGLPDRLVAPGGDEQVHFVMRRLMAATPGSTDAADLREFAYRKDERGVRWQRVSDGLDAGQLVGGEELLPVFPLTYRDDGGHPRTLLGGLVPVGRREEYVAATVDRTPAPPFAVAQRQALGLADPTAPVSKMARVAQFQMEVAEPWKNLIRASFTTAAPLAEGLSLGSDSELPAAKRKRVFEFNLQQQNTSWLILLDFADYLSAHLADVWSVIDGNGAGAAALSGSRKALYDWLGTATMPVALRTALKATDVSPEIRPPQASLRAALKAIRAAGVREKLEGTELSYTNNATALGSADWPPFHFVLAGLDTSYSPAGPYAALASLDAASSLEFGADPLTTPAVAAAETASVDRLTALVGRALEANQEAAAPPVPFAVQVRNALAASIGDAGWFVVRFVHVRRDCGPLHPPLLSPPTQRFQLASFFDADAPARPIRIALPLDTSPAGLRKFNKNTAFVISDMLCGQIQRARGLGLVDLVRSVLPWPLHKDLDLGAGGSCNNGASLSLGMICSISIPIITICALILLIVIVALLDFVFRWLPYFVICFPVPKFKGKQ